MKRLLLFTLIIITSPLIVHSQTYKQYFDGADTSILNSIIVTFDSNSQNTWQIGTPQKTIFDSAATLPFAIITDTTNSYPIDDTSRFYLKAPLDWFGGILALQWKQKLDLETGVDFAMIEYRVNVDSTWQNVFNNPYVYNFYGYDLANVDTSNNGQVGFTATDSVWKDIWLCHDVSYIVSQSDTIYYRFSIISDSVQTNQEGWVLDNFLAHITIIHTIQEKEQTEYVDAFPNPTNGKVTIQVKKSNQFHIINEMILRNTNGEVVKTYGVSPTKFTINISDQPNGIYFLTVKTNLKTETVKIVLQR